MPARPHILLIEDSVPDQLLAVNALRQVYGDSIVVLTASTLREAQQVFMTSEGSISCIILDLILPDADGFGALKAVGRFAPDVPVIVLSGAASEARLVAIMAGAVQVLSKGADYHLLPEAVAAAVEQRRRRTDFTSAVTTRLVAVADLLDDVKQDVAVIRKSLFGNGDRRKSLAYRIERHGTSLGALWVTVCGAMGVAVLALLARLFWPEK